MSKFNEVNLGRIVKCSNAHWVIEIPRWPAFCDRYMNEYHLTGRSVKRQTNDRKKKSDNNKVMSVLNASKDLEEIKDEKTSDTTGRFTEVKPRRFKIKSQAFLKLYQVCLKT